MIITITLNTAIDRTLFIDEFIWDRTIRATESVIGMGGKATDASWILGELNHPNVAAGFVAGEVGNQIERMLQDRGSMTDFVWVEGESRTNIIVVSNKGKGQSTLVSGGLIISDHHLDQFIEKYRCLLSKADCILIGGSVPDGVDPGIYTRLVQWAIDVDVPVVLDSSGPGLISGLEGKPSIIKPNLDEISELAGFKVTSIESSYEAAIAIQKKFGTSVIITHGSKGALAVLQNNAYWIPSLDIPVISTAGAGDGVLAGLALAYANKKPLEEGLKLGFAAAAAVCITPATADCRLSDVEYFLPQIKLIDYK